jgi:transposase
VSHWNRRKTRGTSSGEFTPEAVRLAQDRGVSVAQSARDLDIQKNVLRKLMRQQTANSKRAFLGHEHKNPSSRRSSG